VTILRYWTDALPTAAWISIFWIVIILINVWVVRFFAEVEVFSSTVKFGWMLIAIVALLGRTFPCPLGNSNADY
jgi:amino acid transporter